MKKLFLLLSLFCVTAIVNAQNKDVTKFLGIPVDGTKYEMITKLKAKGFRSSSFDREILQGEFNGRDVNLHIVTNNRKVYRIMVADNNPTSEANIRIQFNKLCRQFKNNEKYVSLAEDDQTIPEDEDISYNINVKNKRYQATFYQKVEDLDSASVVNEVSELILSKYTPEQLSNLSEDEKVKVSREALMRVLEIFTKKSVWFIISEFQGEYYITMYYDNEYNMANGEDL